MPEPVYEVTVKGDPATPAPATPATPTLSEEQINTLVDSKASERAEAIAQSKVEKLKEDLAASLSGKKQGRYDEQKGPKSWDDLHENIVADAEARAEAKMEKKLAEERKANEDKQKQTQAQIEAQQKAEYARMSSEWQEAVADGVLPDIAPAVKEKLTNGVKYEALSEAEQKDPGLKAYNETRLLHIQLQKEGKSNSFYRTASQFYRKQPAGARAPVIGGGGVSTPGGSGEADYDYNEVVKNRKAKFNF